MPGEGRETIRENMRRHGEMTKSGKISVWIGNLHSEDELLSYVDDGPFGRDYAFVLNANAGREKSFDPQTWATHSIFVRAIFIFLGGPHSAALRSR